MKIEPKMILDSAKSIAKLNKPDQIPSVKDSPNKSESSRSLLEGIRIHHQKMFQIQSTISETQMLQQGFSDIKNMIQKNKNNMESFDNLWKSIVTLADKYDEPIRNTIKSGLKTHLDILDDVNPQSLGVLTSEIQYKIHELDANIQLEKEALFKSQISIENFRSLNLVSTENMWQMMQDVHLNADKWSQIQGHPDMNKIQDLLS